VASQIWDNLSTNKLLSATQSSLRPGHALETGILCFLFDILTDVNCSELAAVILQDLSTSIIPCFLNFCEGRSVFPAPRSVGWRRIWLSVFEWPVRRWIAEYRRASFRDRSCSFSTPPIFHRSSGSSPCRYICTPTTRNSRSLPAAFTEQFVGCVGESFDDVASWMSFKGQQGRVYLSRHAGRTNFLST
jgi:hypothetical protein